LVNILQIRNCADIARIRRLLTDLSPCLDFVGLLQGLQINDIDIPNEYVRPNGCLHIAETGSHVVGCSLLSKIDDDVCELKRLFVLPGFRRQGIGSMLINISLAEAESLGYHIMRLETLASMKDAISVYHRFGFCIVPQELRRGTKKTMQMVRVLG
jgi:ribosomal protein S18 acetylase RimI-like enzyme